MVPATVKPGDALLLFASAASDRGVHRTGHGLGVQIGKVADGGEATTVWRKVAVAGGCRLDGAACRPGAPSPRWGVTLAAYRGTDVTNPVASITTAPASRGPRPPTGRPS